MLFNHIFFMRVLFCKIHCPFICFCKPSPHLFTSGPLKLENTPHVSSTCVSVPIASDQLSGESQTIEVKEGNVDGKQQDENILKSSLKKVPPGTGKPKEVDKKRVQWMDNLGKELLEIKEFEGRWVISFTVSYCCLIFYSFLEMKLLVNTEHNCKELMFRY